MDAGSDGPGDAFRALPANDAASSSVAVADTASAGQDAMALVEHGKCDGFAWLATAAGQEFCRRLVAHGAKGGFTDGAYWWLLFGSDADKPPGQAAGRGDRGQGWISTLFADMHCTSKSRCRKDGS